MLKDVSAQGNNMTKINQGFRDSLNQKEGFWDKMAVLQNLVPFWTLTKGASGNKIVVRESSF